MLKVLLKRSERVATERTMRLSFLCSLLVICLSACATTRRYESMVDSWNGKSAAQLITEWGAPSEVKTLADNTKSYAYFRHEKPEAASSSGRTTASEAASDARKGRISCVTEFLINAEGTITGWTLTGYDCRSK